MARGAVMNYLRPAIITLLVVIAAGLLFVAGLLLNLLVPLSF